MATNTLDQFFKSIEVRADQSTPLDPKHTFADPNAEAAFIDIFPVMQKVMQKVRQGEQKTLQSGLESLARMRDNQIPISLTITETGRSDDALATLKIQTPSLGRNSSAKQALRDLIKVNLDPPAQIFTSDLNRGLQITLHGGSAAQLRQAGQNLVNFLESQVEGTASTSKTQRTSLLSHLMIRPISKRPSFIVEEQTKQAPDMLQIGKRLRALKAALMIFRVRQNYDKNERDYKADFRLDWERKLPDLATSSAWRQVIEKATEALLVEGYPDLSVSCDSDLLYFSVHGDSPSSVYQGIVHVLKTFGLPEDQIKNAKLSAYIGPDTGGSQETQQLQSDFGKAIDNYCEVGLPSTPKLATAQPIAPTQAATSGKPSPLPPPRRRHPSVKKTKISSGGASKALTGTPSTLPPPKHTIKKPVSPVLKPPKHSNKKPRE